MILGGLRLLVFGFIAMALAYLLISAYSRSVRRERLEKEWDESGMQGDRASFIADGMKDYENGLRRRLIGLVFVIPTVVIVVLIYFLNFS
jgi:UPF0716 family protein affecting phage T7 exclusion